MGLIFWSLISLILYLGPSLLLLLLSPKDNQFALSCNPRLRLGLIGGFGRLGLCGLIAASQLLNSILKLHLHLSISFVLGHVDAHGVPCGTH